MREHNHAVLPMQTAGTEHFIERTYRESGTYQWVRETLQNALEASATRVEFGIEWQAAESRGIYRRMIADNGRGMTPDELVEFFRTFGGGGKPIGGVHENFGVGAKTSLLPWNRKGVVVVSWVDGEAAMIQVQYHTQRDPKTGEESGEYGLRLLNALNEETDSFELVPVYEPFEDEETGCDWRLVKPDWIEDHGTMIVLLGNDLEENTVLGDSSRAEGDIKGISSYLNRRRWEFPEGVEVYVDELRTQERAGWPASEEEAHSASPRGGADRRTNRRRILGAKYFIKYPELTRGVGKLRDEGTVTLSDGTELDWYLWEGERPKVQSYAAIGGYIGVLYRNELYDVEDHVSRYRTFGVTESKVRRLLWIIARPREADEGNGHHGVYPRTDRNSLLLRGGPLAGRPLPISDWGLEFAEALPAAIRDAISEARGDEGGGITDTSWIERLLERFGARWRIPRLRARRGGGETVDPVQPGSVPRVAPRKRRHGGAGGGGGRGGVRGPKVVGSQPGGKPAEKAKIGGGLPGWRSARAEDLETGMLAAYCPIDHEFEGGVVQINVEHEVLRAEIEYFQSQYPDHLAEEIADEVIKAYGEIAVSKVAHSEHLREIVPSDVIDETFRSPQALTMALLGLMAEEAVISTRIGGRYGRRRAAAS